MSDLHRIFLNYFQNPIFLCVLYLTLTTFQLQATEKTKSEDVVAIQLRAQGIPCTMPSRAKKDKLDSRPDEMVWIISCKEATYRVTLVPHVGAKVDIVEPSDYQLESEK